MKKSALKRKSPLENNFGSLRKIYPHKFWLNRVLDKQEFFNLWKYQKDEVWNVREQLYADFHNYSELVV